MTTHVTILDIGHNGLGDTGASAILDALAAGTNRIRRLNLEANSIGPATAPSIAAFIRSAKENLKYAASPLVIRSNRS